MAINTNNPSVASFQAKYKYKVGGSFDITLSKIGGALKDSLNFSVLKSSRIKETGLLNALKSSALSEGEVNKATAQAKMGFARDAYRLYKKERTEDDATMTAKQSVRALNYSLKELSEATTAYIKARVAGTTTAAEDAKFLADTRLIYNNAYTTAVTLKAPLRQEGEYFSLDLVKSRQYLDKLEADIAVLRAPPVAAAPAVETEPADPATDSPDVVPAEEAHALDVQA
ncbi:MAG TPA: hypothetical protein VEF76_07745 [Patescibacteria group bacterium]|nr:hypothetical protein [Patescibacteria group bacterium]